MSCRLTDHTRSFVPTPVRILLVQEHACYLVALVFNCHASYPVSKVLLVQFFIRQA